MTEYRSTEEKSLGDLFGELSQETSTLIRQEVQLAKAEMSEKVSEIGKNVAILAVGGFLAYAGLLALIATLILILAEVMAGWLAALLVTLVILIIGSVLIMKGLNDLKSINPAPEQTLETLKEDKEWVQRQIQ